MRKYATIVSGLCRSGTSMFMRMLEAGGIEPVMDEEVSRADAFNPFGYYEADIEWGDINEEYLRNVAIGKAIKVVFPYLEQIGHVPARVVIPVRDLRDCVAACSGVGIDIAHPAYKPCTAENLMNLHIDALEFLAKNKIPTLIVGFDQARRQPIIAASEVDEFLGGGLDVEAMTKVVKPREIMTEIRRRWHETP